MQVPGVLAWAYIKHMEHMHVAVETLAQPASTIDTMYHYQKLFNHPAMS